MGRLLKAGNNTPLTKVTNARCLRLICRSPDLDAVKQRESQFVSSGDLGRTRLSRPWGNVW